MLAGSFSSDHPALTSRWGTLNLDGGMRPPYNLSTDYNHIKSVLRLSTYGLIKLATTKKQGFIKICYSFLIIQEVVFYFRPQVNLICTVSAFRPFFFDVKI